MAELTWGGAASYTGNALAARLCRTAYFALLKGYARKESFFPLQCCLDIKENECNDNFSALHLGSIETLKLDNMDDFTRSCSNAEQYPKNLLADSAPVYTRRAIEDQLNQRSHQLFCDEAIASSRLRPSLSLLEGSAEGAKSLSHDRRPQADVIRRPQIFESQHSEGTSGPSSSVWSNLRDQICVSKTQRATSGVSQYANAASARSKRRIHARG